MKTSNINSVKIILSVAVTIFVLTTTSCSSSISIKANTDCSSDFKIEADVGTIVYSTIQSVTSGLNEISGSASVSSEPHPLFSSTEIEKALSSGDVKNLKAETPSSSSINISGTVLAPENQTSVLENDNIKIANFITCKKNSLTLIVAPSTIKGFVNSLPEEQRSYLDLLMAPVLTGEEMSVEDYISMVGAVYGEKMQNELSEAAVKITLVSPEGYSLKKSALSDTKNVKTSSNKAVFTISLAEFLTLDSAKTFSISW